MVVHCPMGEQTYGDETLMESSGLGIKEKRGSRVAQLHGVDFGLQAQPAIVLLKLWTSLSFLRAQSSIELQERLQNRRGISMTLTNFGPVGLSSNAALYLLTIEDGESGRAPC